MQSSNGRNTQSGQLPTQRRFLNDSPAGDARIRGHAREWGGETPPSYSIVSVQDESIARFTNGSNADEVSLDALNRNEERLSFEQEQTAMLWSRIETVRSRIAMEMTLRKRAEQELFSLERELDAEIERGRQAALAVTKKQEELAAAREERDRHALDLQRLYLSEQEALEDTSEPGKQVEEHLGVHDVGTLDASQWEEMKSSLTAATTPITATRGIHSLHLSRSPRHHNSTGGRQRDHKQHPRSPSSRLLVAALSRPTSTHRLGEEPVLDSPRMSVVEDRKLQIDHSSRDVGSERLEAVDTRDMRWRQHSSQHEHQPPKSANLPQPQPNLPQQINQQESESERPLEIDTEDDDDEEEDLPPLPPQPPPRVQTGNGNPYLLPSTSSNPRRSSSGMERTRWENLHKRFAPQVEQREPQLAGIQRAEAPPPPAVERPAVDHTMSQNGVDESKHGDLVPVRGFVVRFLVVSCDPDVTLSPLKSVQQGVWNVPARVNFCYPPGTESPLSLWSSFAFPDGVSVRPLDLNRSNTNLHSALFGHGQFRRGQGSFVFMCKNQSLTSSTDQFGRDFVYGACVVADRIRTLKDTLGRERQALVPECVCLLSHTPIFDTLFQALYSLLALRRIHHLSNVPTAFGSPYASPNIEDVASCQEHLRRIFSLQLPAPGDSIQLPATHGLPEIKYVRDKNSVSPDELVYQQVSRWACPVAFANMDAERLLLLLELVLREFKVIVVCEEMGLLTSCVLGLSALIYPLIWVSVFLPLLPKAMSEFLDAPVPYLVGMTHLHPTVHSIRDFPEHTSTAVWFPSKGTSKKALWLPTSFESTLFADNRQTLLAMLDKLLDSLRYNMTSTVEAPSSGIRALFGGTTKKRQVKYGVSPEAVTATQQVLKVCSMAVHRVLRDSQNRDGPAPLTLSGDGSRRNSHLISESQMLAHYFASGRNSDTQPTLLPLSDRNRVEKQNRGVRPEVTPLPVRSLAGPQRLSLLSLMESQQEHKVHVQGQNRVESLPPSQPPPPPAQHQRFRQPQPLQDPQANREASRSASASSTSTSRTLTRERAVSVRNRLEKGRRT